MGDTDKKVIGDFLTNHWAVFVEFAAKFGINERRCDDIVNELGNAKYEDITNQQEGN